MANNAVFEFRHVAFDKNAFDGKAWAPLKDGDHEPLQDTLALRQSIRVLRRAADAAVVGSTKDYARYQNWGTDTIPQRQFIGNTKTLNDKNRMVLRALLRKKL